MGRFLDLNVPNRHRDSTITAEEAELIELAPHQAAGAIGGDYWQHLERLATAGSSTLGLSTVMGER